MNYKIVINDKVIKWKDSLFSIKSIPIKDIDKIGLTVSNFLSGGKTDSWTKQLQFNLYLKNGVTDSIDMSPLDKETVLKIKEMLGK